MRIVKKTNEYIVKAFTYICNSSVQSGIFPEKMKTPKVILVFENVRRFCHSNWTSFLR